MFTTLFIAWSLVNATRAQYALHSNFSGPGFLDQFDFWSGWDPTYGYVDYVDRPTAESLAMVNSSGTGTRFGAEATEVLDPSANLGRKSIRLTSHQTWTHGLFVIDLAHMPSSTCGIWPAFWMLGNGPLLWPTYGEIDIIEFTNDATSDLIALHTMPNCTVAGAGQTGTLLTNDCGEDQGFKGCNISPTQPNSAGTDFNANGGGIYAVQWTSVAISVWFFPRNNIPATVTTSTPDPSTWGLPTANFQGSCDIDSYFSNASLVFNIDFCGTWAGPTFNTNNSCPVLDVTNAWSSCNMYVAGNPQAFAEAYWEVNYLHVFQTIPGSPAPESTSASLSSVTPAESTTSVSASGAVGHSTTTTSTTTTSTFLPSTQIASSSIAGSTGLPITSSTFSTASTSRPAPAVIITTEVILVTNVVTVTRLGGQSQQDGHSVLVSMQTVHRIETASEMTSESNSAALVSAPRTASRMNRGIL